MNLTLHDVHAARDRIRGRVVYTPCPESIPLSELCGSRIFCKLDYLQRTGSFKERGACNALAQLSPEQRERGVVAASAGNHALGLAYHGKLLNIPVTVVMPQFAPLIKITTCRRLGARVILHGETFDEARAQVDALVRDEGLTHVHGFDDPAIIAGQGTIALEVLNQAPQAEAIVVPVGGGGLIAGVSLAVKTVRPDVQVIGVEPEAAASLTAALEAGRPVKAPVRPSVADGLAVAKVGELALRIARERVDRVVQVSEQALALAVLRLMELEKGVVEGAGAAPLAAFLDGRLPELAGRTVVLLLCGGNIDTTILSRIIEKGLAADGRLFRFTARLSDRPGSLAHLAQVIASVGASVKEVTHDRAFSGPDVTAVSVVCTVETADQTHIRTLLEALAAAEIAVSPASIGNGA